MNKGQFTALTVALGLATMGGAGYIAYASSNPHGSGAHNNASSNNAAGTGTGSGPQQSQSASPGDGGAAAGSPSAQGTGTSAPTGTGAAACGNGDITISTSDSQGAAGHESMLLVFTNTSTHPCVLHGYPGASLFGQNGQDLLDAKRTLSGYSGGAVGMTSTPKVLLQPSETASAVLEWSDVPTGSGANGGCAVTDALSIGVTPPNTKQTTTIPVDQPQVCSEFQIHPVLKGIVHSPGNA